MIQLIIVFILVLVFVWIQLKVYVNHWMDNLEVDLQFENKDIFVGEEGCLKEIIINDKWLPLSLINIKFQTSRHLLFVESMASQTTDLYYRNDVFSIGGHEKITRSLKFVADKRGCHRIHSIDLISGDLFMLTTVRKTLETEEYVYVYPSPYYDKEILHSLQMVSGLVQTRRQFLEDPFEYRGIREYQPYDDMKSINWKATAKTGEFKVNLRDFTAVKSVRIFLNLEDDGILKRTDETEVAIRLATGIIKFFTSKGIKVACYGNCKDGLNGQLLSHNRESRVQEIYRSLACIDLTKGIQSFTKHYENRLFNQINGEYTFIISVNAYDEFIELLQRYSRLSEDFIWYYPKNYKEEPKIPWNLQRFFIPVNTNYVS